MSRPTRDAVIIGGGMAGLTLALQLRRELGDLDITVIERQRFPVPEITHKVGESTVELGSHYLAEVIGLRDHLDESQLRKFGLRFFFGAGANPIHQADELGVSQSFDTPTWQVDRGILENELARRARAAGIELLDGTRVERVEVDPHRRVTWRDGETERHLDARWVMDAASRTSPLKRALGLKRDNRHDINACWFRVEGEVRLDDFSEDADWQSRTPETARWLSTNQMLGPGYWVWVIPLPSNATSIGIVADPDFHPLDTFNTEDRALAWLAQHEPRLRRHLEGHALLDYRFLRHFSHDCRRLFSPQGWAFTGESGVFADPLYSPGTDFIAIANTFIVDLVRRSMAGDDISARALALEAVFRSLFQNTLSLYQGLYPVLGDARTMVMKTTWDYTYYWSLVAMLFFQGAMDQPASDGPLRNRLLEAVSLNADMQRQFAARADQAGSYQPSGQFFDQRQVPLLYRSNEQLRTPLGDGGLMGRVGENLENMQVLAGFIQRRFANPRCVARGQEAELVGDWLSRPVLA